MSGKSKAWNDARKYFGIENKPDMVLHHIDIELRQNDPKRYDEWRPEDLTVMSRSAHTSLHQTGRTLTDEHKALISKVHKGKIVSAETRAKQSKARKGKKLSAETRAKLSKPVVCLETGATYTSLAEAAAAVSGAFDGTISQCCRGIRKTAGGFHWNYVEK